MVSSQGTAVVTALGGMPEEDPPWQRLGLEDHPSQKCCLGVTLVWFLPVVLPVFHPGNVKFTPSP